MPKHNYRHTFLQASDNLFALFVRNSWGEMCIAPFPQSEPSCFCSSSRRKGDKSHAVSHCCFIPNKQKQVGESSIAQKGWGEGFVPLSTSGTSLALGLSTS